MAGGMTAGEAVVFWLGGFSSDPKYPISGEGGRRIRFTQASASTAESNTSSIRSRVARRWMFPFKVDRLGPRATDGYFDESKTALL